MLFYLAVCFFALFAQTTGKCWNVFLEYTAYCLSIISEFRVSVDNQKNVCPWAQVRMKRKKTLFPSEHKSEKAISDEVF